MTSGYVHVVKSEEPWLDDEIYVFDTPEAAESFARFKGGRVSEEPVLDMAFVREARKAEREAERERHP